MRLLRHDSLELLTLWNYLYHSVRLVAKYVERCTNTTGVYAKGS